MNSVRPPRVSEALFRVLLDPTDRDPAMGDLHEEFCKRASAAGHRAAARWYRGQLLRAVGPSLRRRAASWLNADLIYEVRVAARSLRHRPGMTFVSVLTLGLGIGATTAIYSVVDTTLLRPLPYPDQDRLVQVWNTYPHWRGDPVLDGYWDHVELSYPEFEDWRAAQTVFDETALYATWRTNFTGAGDPTVLKMGYASASLFPMLGVAPQVGRLFSRNEVGRNAPRLAVISDGLWRERFGASTSVVGTTMTLDDVPFEVIGVLPRGFLIRGMNGPPSSLPHDVWIPIGGDGDSLDRGSHNYEALGLLRPTATLQAAREETTALLRAELPPERRGARLEWRRDEELGAARRPLFMLLGSVALLLLVACANVAGLVLADTTRRHREVSMRAALGASRGQIVRQLLTESVLLGLGGAALGTLLAVSGTGILLRWAPTDLPLPTSVGVEPRALGVALFLGLGTGVVLGLLPAVRATRRNLVGTLRESRVNTSAGRTLQRLLTAGQVALSLVLIVSGILLARSFDAMLRTDPGFRTVDLVSARLTLSQSRYPTSEEAGAFFHSVVDRLKETPGITAATGTSTLPFSGQNNSSSFRIVGRDVVAGEKSPEGSRRTVLPDFHRMMGISLLEGRFLDESDREFEAPVVVVSRAMVDEFWPDGDALGARILRDRREFEVVGIVSDILHGSLSEAATPTFYVPFDVSEHRHLLNVAVRSELPVEQVVGLMREVVSGVDPAIPLEDVATMSDRITELTRPEVFRTTLIGAFGVSAALLAALGIFGSVTRLTNSRRREMGVRLALGARETQLTRRVVREEGRVLIAGLALGLVGAGLIASFLESFLFGIGPRDPATYVGGAGLLGLVGLAATSCAAYGSVRLDPVEAMRAE